MKKYVVSDAECSVKSDLEEPRIFKMGVEKDRENLLHDPPPPPPHHYGLSSTYHMLLAYIISTFRAAL